jgi:outer membrane protein assembly factor BamB
MITSGKPEIGLVRFSLVGLPTERVMDGEEYIDVFAGLDGLVYGLQSNGDTVDVIEPGSGLPMDVILLDAPARGIAVAEDGTIVGAAFDGNIYLLDATGGVLMSLAAQIESLVDVDLASDGTIAVSSSLGNVVIVEPGLGNIVWSWDAGGDETFLEFLE